jgi:prolyl-tRNA synthetase
MRYSKMFGKTSKSSKEYDSTNATLLVKAGFIKESTGGRYFMLPLGQRVANKIMDVIRSEMNKAGAQEMLTPILHPLALWTETKRDNEMGFELMKVTDRREVDFVLGGTAEEMFVDVVRKFPLSYKDLPVNLYQFSLKFRDELRVRSGLLRVREFVMKDAYSFDVSEEEFKKSYELMGNTYSKIFDQFGLKTRKVLADNGYIGGEYCHEYVVDSPIGESKYLMTSDGNYCAHEDVAEFDREALNPKEAPKTMEIFDQPQGVQTMDDNVKHYNLPKAHFLKNVVYKNRVTNEIVIAVLRGDLEVNKTKLEHVVDAVGQLEDATDEDLVKLGTKTGYVHSWGHKGARYIGDLSLTTVINFIGGQKEDTTDSRNVNYGRDFTCEKLADIAVAKEGFSYKDQKLTAGRGIEVGNIFQLGYHYSKKMAGANFTAKDGTEKPYYMGCYGIGIGRTLATVVEIMHDDKGIIWPENVAPFKVHLLGLNLEDEITKEQAEAAYNQLREANVEVLFDDRTDVTAGEKFADADLIGIPYRAVISKKTNGKVELKKRNEDMTQQMSLDELLHKVSY